MADTDKSLPTLATELWELVVAYLKQETLEPLKGLGRFVGWGLAGAFLLTIGLVTLVVGGLRALQVETAPHLAGHLSWVPYIVTLVGTGIIAGLVASRIGTARRKARR